MTGTTPSSTDVPPTRPKKTASDYLGLAIVWLMFGCAAIAIPAFFYVWFGQLRDDYWLPYKGALARESSVSYYHVPTQRTGAEVCVSYVSGRRAKHDKCVDFEPEFFHLQPDRSRPMIVHYDPAAPDHISTSWGGQLLPIRTFTFLVYGIPCLLIELISVIAVVSIPTGHFLKAQRAGSRLPPSNNASSATVHPVRFKRGRERLVKSHPGASAARNASIVEE